MYHLPEHRRQMRLGHLHCERTGVYASKLIAHGWLEFGQRQCCAMLSADNAVLMSVHADAGHRAGYRYVQLNVERDSAAEAPTSWLGGSVVIQVPKMMPCQCNGSKQLPPRFIPLLAYLYI